MVRRKRALSFHPIFRLPWFNRVSEAVEVNHMKTLFAGLLLLATALSAAGPHIVARIPVGGDGGWDYLLADSAAHRLYVSHATHVVVIDTEARKVVGDIPDTPGVHGIALVPALGKGYVSNGSGNNVTVFDINSLKVTGHVATGKNPDAIIYEPASKMIYTFNGGSSDATVIDPATNTVKATIPMGGKPEFAAVDGKGGLWVNVEDTHEMAVIDTAAMKIAKRYVLEGCEDPSGLALDGKVHHLFSVCGNKVMVVSDPATGKVIATVPIGGRSDGAAFDAGMAFSSNGEGSLTVVGKVKGNYQAITTIPTQMGSRNITVDPKTHLLYLPAAKFGAVPAATKEQPRPRPTMIPDSFEILVVAQ